MFLLAFKSKYILLFFIQELLSLEFDLVEGAEVWHPDVTLVSSLAYIQQLHIN